MSIITKEFYKNQENQKLTSMVSWEITDCLRQNGVYGSSNNVSLAAYLLCKVSQYNNPFGFTIREISEGAIEISEDVRYLVKERISETTWERLLKLVSRYSTEQFALTALRPMVENEYKSTMITPDSILKLAHRLLNIEPEEKVANVCCGSGSYLVSGAMEEPDAVYYGFDINVENSTIAQIRAELVGAKTEIRICDVFTLPGSELEMKFDKIFSNYPFGLKLKNLGAGAEYLEKLSQQYPGLSKATSSDWVYNALLCELLTENGKAVGIMTNGSTWNSIDTAMRKYFVEQKLVECVISLPNRMFSTTNIPTTLIVLSHNNDSVRMIDASKICQQGRRQNEFSDLDISAIMEALTVDSEYSKEVSIGEIRNNEYNLSLSRYAENKVVFANGAPFESIIKSITRGAPCKASQLDEMVSDNITNMQYLMLANIQNGMIDDKLPYLSEIDKKYEKYCLKNNNLILSKNGYPYKIAVASVKEGQQILANGNLYIIELDEEKANPYYIKAFFESEQGTAVLKSITVGATIPNIGVDKLKKIEIPLPPLEEQERIAQKYQATLDEISMIKIRLEKAINKLHHIFDEECE